MNLDLSIQRMAFREAETQTAAQSLVAKKRGELELQQLRQRVLEGSQSSNADLDAALRRMEAESEQLVQQRAPADSDTGTQLDKTA